MSDRLVFNGINGSTGEYLLPPLTTHQLSQLAQGVGLDDDQVPELKTRHFGTQPSFAVQTGVDPDDLAQAGWGVVFAHGADPALKDALGELLAFRQAAAGDLFKVYEGVAAYRPGESKDDFLSRHGAGPGFVVPTNVPYYLLLVGDPEAIPYRFQYQLDVQYAVGRLHFDTLAEYARYAKNVVEAEQGKVRLPRRAAFFGVRNEGDGATQLSADDLVAPLAEQLGEEQPGWQVEVTMGDPATKAKLAALLGGAETPALLFSASHGMGFDLKDPRHGAHQGALLCQEWPGPLAAKGEIGQECYLAADDVGDDAHLRGLIAFHFACFGAGTPRLDDFAHLAWGKRTAIARQAFVAPLPRRLLGHPRGGALAAIGHVERAWGSSFYWGKAGRQTETFRSTLTALMEGHRVGSALESFNSRYAELSSDLSSRLEEIRFGEAVDDAALSALWTANNDARGYAVIGDPAVRLPLAAEEIVAAERPDLGDVSLPTPSGTHMPPPAAPPAQAAVTAGAVAGETPLPAGAVSYGFLWWGDDDSFKETRERITEALKGLAEDVGRVLHQAISDASELNVSTYVSADLSRIGDAPNQQAGEQGSEQPAEQTTEAAEPAAAPERLRALTRISLDGDTVVYVPEDAGDLDATLWAIHADMVARAQAGRAEMIRTAAAALGGILGTARPF